MNQQVLVQEKNEIETTPVLSIQQVKEYCDYLMGIECCKNIGQQGMLAIIHTANTMGIDPIKAVITRQLYHVPKKRKEGDKWIEEVGNVEMSARFMNALIRSKKHSITKDRRSDETICILHGKRIDNGDTWTAKYSIEDAKRAGLIKEEKPFDKDKRAKSAWEKNPEDMLFARALSRLARQLFPDVIGNCYVEGEVSLDANIPVSFSEHVEENKEITDQQLASIGELLADQPSRENNLYEFIGKNWGKKEFQELSYDQAQWVIERLHSTKEKELQEVSA